MNISVLELATISCRQALASAVHALYYMIQCTDKRWIFSPVTSESVLKVLFLLWKPPEEHFKRINFYINAWILYDVYKNFQVYSILKYIYAQIVILLNTVEPLNYRHPGTTLTCLQQGGVLYTGSAPGNVITLSSCCIPNALLGCREALKC